MLKIRLVLRDNFWLLFLYIIKFAFTLQFVFLCCCHFSMAVIDLGSGRFQCTQS